MLSIFNRREQLGRIKQYQTPNEQILIYILCVGFFNCFIDYSVKKKQFSSSKISRKFREKSAETFRVLP